MTIHNTTNAFGAKGYIQLEPSVISATLPDGTQKMTSGVDITFSFDKLDGTYPPREVCSVSIDEKLACELWSRLGEFAWPQKVRFDENFFDDATDIISGELDDPRLSTYPWVRLDDERIVLSHKSFKSIAFDVHLAKQCQVEESGDGWIAVYIETFVPEHRKSIKTQLLCVATLEAPKYWKYMIEYFLENGDWPDPYLSYGYAQDDWCTSLTDAQIEETGVFKTLIFDPVGVYPATVDGVAGVISSFEDFWPVAPGVYRVAIDTDGGSEEYGYVAIYKNKSAATLEDDVVIMGFSFPHAETEAVLARLKELFEVTE